MSARGAPRLGAGLIARKGEAAPAPALPPAPGADTSVTSNAASTGGEPLSLEAMLGQAPLQTNQARMSKAREAAATTRGTHATVAVTVRLDQARYERLKLHGAKRRRTNQDLIVEALDRYLDANAE